MCTDTRTRVVHVYTILEYAIHVYTRVHSVPGTRVPCIQYGTTVYLYTCSTAMCTGIGIRATGQRRKGRIAQGNQCAFASQKLERHCRCRAVVVVRCTPMQVSKIFYENGTKHGSEASE